MRLIILYVDVEPHDEDDPSQFRVNPPMTIE